jgi:CRP/FNR family transcriptional regulator
VNDAITLSQQAARMPGARQVQVPGETIVIRPGQICSEVFFIASGTVRVQLLDGDGRELVLYRLGMDEPCVFQTSTALSESRHAVSVIADTEVSAVGVPIAAFRQAVAGDELFRSRIFSRLSQRIVDLVQLSHDLAYGRLEIRLLERVLQLRDERGCVSVTHQQLAVELGTAREVVTRALGQLQKRELLHTERGLIRVCDEAAIRALIAGT